MRRLFVLTAVLIPVWSQRAVADRCGAIASRVMEATGASFVRDSQGGKLLRHPMLAEDDFAIYCGDESANPASRMGGPDVSMHWNGARPPDGFFTLASRAGAALTGDSQSSTLSALLACHRRALGLLTSSETQATVDELVMGKTAVECRISKRDGGAADFTIYRYFPSTKK